MTAWICLFGLIIGSFLNVCIYRIPQNQSICYPSSHCKNCKVTLRPWDLVPILSYIVLRGKCRYCNATVSLRYPLVEFLTGIIFVGCYLVFGLTPDLIPSLILSSFLIVITFIDYDHQLILDKVLIWLAGAGVVINLYTGNVSIVDMILAALLGGGIILLIAIISRGGMGGGDIKFVAALGLWFGLPHTALILFLSFIFGGIGGVVLLLLKLKGRKDFIPFGPYIAIAAFITMLYGNDLIHWYITRFL